MPRIIEAFKQFLDNNGDPLIDGTIRFLESNSNNTDKDTYADVNETIANTNPVQLSASGRCPNVFGTGEYRAITYDSDAQQIQQFDPVPGGETGVSQLGDWSALVSYPVGFVVTGSDGSYYRSLSAANTGNDPISDSSNWEELKFVQVYNANVTYAVGALVSYAGSVYIVTTATTAGDTPVSATTKFASASNSLMNTSYRQAADANATGAVTLDYAAGDVVQLTMTGAITGFTTSNFISGEVCSIVIDAVDWGNASYSVAHPAAWLFAAGTAPEYTAGGTDRLVLYKNKDDVFTLHIVD